MIKFEVKTTKLNTLKMKNYLLTAVACLFIGSMTVSAQTPELLENGKYEIKLGDVTMTIDAQKGGKITSFRYNDTEMISQSRFPNSYGSTFWTSPQSEWHWPPVPEFETKPFEAEIVSNALILTGQKTEKFGYRLKKKISTRKKDKAFIITYTIVNESDQVKQVAPWEITRTPNGGFLFFEADKATAGYGKEPINFEYSLNAAWFNVDASRGQRKGNADGTGWIGFLDRGLLFAKSFQDLKEGEPAPGEDEIQIYIHNGKTYIEIEEQGASVTLQPGEEVSWTVKWYLVPCDLPAEPSEALLKKVRKTIR